MIHKGNRWILFRTALLFIAVLGIVIAGCVDKTGTPENKAQTEKRQAIIEKHKEQ